MIADRSPLTVVREPAWSTLVRRCDAAVARDPRLDATVTSLLRPVRMLDAMANDALGALGEDVLRADRLRVLLHGAWPYAAQVAEAGTIARELEDPKRLVEAAALAEHGVKAAPAASKLPDALPYELGVIDPGVLVLVAIAAIRVAPAGYGMVFLRTVHGIALSASGAETIGRLDPDMPDVAAMVPLLETLQVVASLGGAMRSPLLRPFASDPVERGRWSCLQQLLANGRMLNEANAAPPPDHFSPGLWDGAIAYPVTRVRPAAARPGSKIVLEGVRALARAKMHVVFASPDGPTLLADPVKGGDDHSVIVPPGARSGWIGLCDAELIDRANRHRDSVAAWLESLADQPCLRGMVIPAHRIPRLGTKDPRRSTVMVSTPPRIGTNHYTDATPRIADVAITQSGETKLRAGLALDVAVTLEAPVHGATASVRIGTTVIGPVPVDGARAMLAIPAAFANDGLVFTAAVASDGVPADTRDQGPLRMDGARELTVVLFLTALAPGDGRKQPARVTREQARRMLDGLQERLGWDIKDVELPWVDDALAGIGAPLASADDHRVQQLQRDLSRRALITPGLEHAIWLALVPGTSPVAAASPAAGARSVAVATVAGLASLIANAAVDDTSVMTARATRLRILGTLRPGTRTTPAVIDLEWVQQEDRAAGPGAAVDSGLVAVALDASGTELAVTPIRVLDTARPIRVEALIPIGPNVDVVELRTSRAVLKRLVRTSGRPELHAVKLEKIDDFESRLLWSYRHSDGALPHLQLALVQDEVTTPVDALDPCDPNASVNFARFGRADDLVVLANDGWNAVGRSARRELANETPVVLRRLDDGRFWADVPAGWQVRWTLDGVFQGTGLTLDLPDPANGVLEIAAEHDGMRLVDTRVVGGR